MLGDAALRCRRRMLQVGVWLLAAGALSLWRPATDAESR